MNGIILLNILKNKQTKKNQQKTYFVLSLLLILEEGHSSNMRAMIQPGLTLLTFPGESCCLPGRLENMAIDHSHCRTGMPMPVLNAPNIPAELYHSAFTLCRIPACHIQVKTELWY